MRPERDRVLAAAAEVDGARAAGFAEMIRRAERIALVHSLRSRMEVPQAMALLGHLGLDLDAIERWAEAVPAIRKVWTAIGEEGSR
jgi:hypothetical protein